MEIGRCIGRRKPPAVPGSHARLFRYFHLSILPCLHRRWRKLPEPLRVLVQAAALLLLAWLAWRWYYIRYELRAISDPDAEDYAQIARQLALGHGLTSLTMPLCGLEYLRQSGADPSGQPFWPNLHRFPFMPLVEWGLFRLFRPSDGTLSLASGIFYLGSVPLVYLLGRRVFGNGVGLAGAVLHLFSPPALGASVSGLTEPATTFLLMATLLLLTGPRGRPATALAGVAWGICFWNRYTCAMVALPLSAYLWAQDRRRAPGNVAAFLIAMGVTMAPEMLRNARLAGDPLFSVTAALMVPFKSALAPTVHGWYIPVYVKPMHTLLAWPGAIAEKWIHEFYGGWRHLPLLLGLEHLYPLLLLSLFLRAESAAQRRLRLLTLALVALHELTLPFLSNIVRYYAYLSPLLLLFAAWGGQVLARQVGPALWPRTSGEAGGPRLLGRTIPAAVALVLLGSPMVIGWVKMDGPRPGRDPSHALVDAVRSHMLGVREAIPPEKIVLSNAPWSIAWRARRKSVPLPPGPSLVPLLAREYHLDIGGIYLTPRTIGAWETPNWGAWEAVRAGERAVPGFVAARRFRDGALLLVRDRGAPPKRPIGPLLPEEELGG
ncbi:MAG: glycosyltransferase family 39 protein [Armatimonadetes bacterium]|nr:glycosyltransferase family 39 protein [Armatimonadota bacterium]